MAGSDGLTAGSGFGESIPGTRSSTAPGTSFNNSAFNSSRSSADKLKERGINFQIVSLGVDTSTADGRLAFTVVAAVAEHERNRLSERTKQGLEAARKRGKVLGPKRKMTDRQIRNAIKRIKAGEDRKKVAQQYNVHPWTLTRNINRIAS